MRAIFLTTLENGQPKLPPMTNEEGGIQLHEVVDGKVRDGCGYSCLGEVPGAVPTVLVLVDTSEETINAMIADSAYELVEVLSG